MIKETDVVKFVVSYKSNGELTRQEFSTFASAAGCASALNNITRMIDVRATSPCGQSAWSACMYIYSAQDNTRRVANNHAVNEVLKLGGTQ